MALCKVQRTLKRRGHDWEADHVQPWVRASLWEKQLLSGLQEKSLGPANFLGVNSVRKLDVFQRSQEL